jgi:uncharacterized phiE125 gp8 family phage protein
VTEYPQNTWRRHPSDALAHTTALTPTPVGPVLLGALRDHVRVLDSSQDAILIRYADAAGEQLEADARRVLLTTAVVEYYDVWPWDAAACVQLHRAPVASVDAIKYYDPDDVLQTWDSANYDTDLVNEPARIVVAENAALSSPNVDQRLNAVQIEYTAGYGTTIDDLPPLAVVAMLKYAAHQYDSRDLDTVTDNVWNAAIRDLIWRVD